MEGERRASGASTGETAAVNSEEASVEAVTPALEAIDQPVLGVIKIPAVLLLLRFVAAVLEWLSRPQRLLPGLTSKVVLSSGGDGLIGDGKLLLEGTVPRRPCEPDETQPSLGVEASPPHAAGLLHGVHDMRAGSACL